MPTQHHSETEPSPTRSENEVEEEEEEEEEEEGEEEEGEEEEEEADYEDDELEIGESYSDKDNMNDDNDDNDDDEDTVAVDAAADEEIEEEDNADDNEDDDEYVVVNLATIREEMQCPICLGIIRKTRTVMECLHRFCRDCIDKSMRLGNNECPACRTHCASRRSLRDDPNYDALIAALYPDIDKYEEEELALHEEEERRNKQIQASIADTFRRQSEAITRRRRSAKATAAAFVRKANSKFCGIPGQSRANNRVSTRSKRTRKGSATEGEIQKQYSDAEETEQTRWHRKRRKASSSLHENSFDLDEAEEDNNEGSGDSQAEASRGSTDASPGNARKTRLAWGKGGARSHMKYASVRGSHSRNNRTTYATKMVDHILNKKYEEDESKFDIHFMLQPYENEENIPSLKRPYLCCPPTLTVKHICKFLSRFSSISPEDIEIVIEKQSGLLNASQHSKLFQCQGKLAKGKSVFGVSTSENFFGVLNQDRTLAEIFVACPEFKGNMVLMYRTKE